MSKALILGGAGFIGGHLARALAESGESLDVVDNFSRGVRDPFLRDLGAKPNVRLIDGDIVGETLGSQLADDYSVIYQLAAIIGVRHVVERPYDVLCDNIAIQAKAIELGRKQKGLARFVFASTSEVYAGSLLHTNMPIPTPETVPLALTDLAQPRTSYMLSKIYGEALCHQSGLSFTIVRPHNLYGPRMGLVHVLPELMLKARGLPVGGTLPVASPRHHRTFCYIDDAVEILRRLAAAPAAAHGTFNVGNQDPEVSIGEIARLVLETMGRSDVEILRLPDTPGSPARRCPDMSWTVGVTGFRPKVALEDGIRRTYRWYDENVFARGGVSAT